MLRSGIPAAAVGRDSVRTLFTGRGDLYFWKAARYFPVYGDGDVDVLTVTLEDCRRGPHRYSIVLYAEDEEVLRQPIGNGLTLNYSFKENSVHWPSFTDGESKLLAFKFSDKNSAMSANMATNRFLEMYNRCTYALLTQSEVDSNFEEDEAYKYVGSIAASQLPTEDYEEPMYELDVGQEKLEATGTGNVCYSESMRYNRAVVVRKAKDGVEVQAHAFGNDGSWQGDPEMMTFRECTTCDQALLDDTNTKLLLLSLGDNELHQADLEYGKVVQNYTLPAKVRSVTYGAYKPDVAPVYTCLSDKAAFNVDLRMDPRHCVVMEPGRTLSDYRLQLAKPLTCHATSAEGHLVTADGLGNIRLYTGPPGSRRANGKFHPKMAKTLLETKVPILAVDVTADGKYVLAVSAKFLLFMPIAYITENGDESNGFLTRMGQNKPQPLKLQPTPGQLAVLGGIEKLDFVSGCFDRYDDDRGVCITAWSGNYVFTWGLEAARQAEENGRACLGVCSKASRTIIGLSASVPERVTYLTDRDIRMAPLKSYRRVEKGSKHYAYS